MSSTPTMLDEFELIRRYFQRTHPAAQSGVVLGIGDDAAVLTVPPGQELIAAVDTLVAGRHFLANTSARSIGHRALAVNLSDMAAMGAEPKWATLALTLPEANADWLTGFAEGFMDLAQRFNVALVGGDTTRGPLTISVQILGIAPTGTALRRAGARAGDLLAVTGTLGDSGAGLKFAVQRPQGIDGHCIDTLIQRFDFPTPRVEFGLAARGLASAAMDVSDGLVADLPKLAHASGLAAHVAIEQLPISRELRAVASEAQARDWALGAGDDYELLLALPRNNLTKLNETAQRLNLTLSIIGQLTAGSGVQWMLNGERFAPGVLGYNHFG
jgi:thiamine-monophosphate kinase